MRRVGVDEAVLGAAVGLLFNVLTAVVAAAVVGALVGMFWAIVSAAALGSYSAWAAVDTVLSSRGR